MFNGPVFVSSISAVVSPRGQNPRDLRFLAHHN